MIRSARRALALAVLVVIALVGTGTGRARADAPSAPPLELDLGGRDRARLLLTAQLRATGTGGEDAQTEGALTLPRIRPCVRVTLLDRRLSVALTLNTSPVALELIELWAEGVVVPELLRVRAGQWKVPFTRYRAMSFSDLSFVDWARIVTVPFGAEHSLGVAAAGTVPGTGTEWDLGVFVGPPTRTSHGTGLATTYGERLENLSELGALRAVDRVHPELVGRVTQWLGGARGGDGAELTLSVAGDLSPEPRRDLALRAAPEVHARLGMVSGLVVLYAGLAPIGEDPLAPALFGALAELAVTPIPELELALRFARTARTPELLADARAHTAQVVADAPMEERDAIAAQHARAEHLYAEQEVAIGASWQIVGRALELQGDAAWLLAESDHETTHGWRLRLQVQLVL